MHTYCCHLHVVRYYTVCCSQSVSVPPSSCTHDDGSPLPPQQRYHTKTTTIQKKRGKHLVRCPPPPPPTSPQPVIAHAPLSPRRRRRRLRLRLRLRHTITNTEGGVLCYTGQPGPFGSPTNHSHSRRSKRNERRPFRLVSGVSQSLPPSSHNNRSYSYTSVYIYISWLSYCGQNPYFVRAVSNISRKKQTSHDLRCKKLGCHPIYCSGNTGRRGPAIDDSTKLQ